MAETTPDHPRRTVHSSGFARSALMMFGGAAGAQLITFAVMPALTRLFSPEAVGAYALVVSVSATLMVVATLRLDLAVVLPEEDGVAARIWWLAFYQGLAVAVLVCLVAASFEGVIGAAVTADLSSAGWVWLLAPMVVASVVTQMGTGVATRTGRFELVMVSNVTLAAVFAVVALAIGLIAPGDLGMVVARVAGVVAGTLSLLTIVVTISRPEAAWRLRGLGPHRLWRDQRQFLVFNTPYSLVGSLTRDLPLYVFLVGGGPAVAASYALARTITQAPTTLISGAISSVFYREAALHLGTPRLKALALTLSRWGLVTTIPGFVLLTVWGDEIFVLVFGPEWREAGRISSVLAVPLWLALQNGWPQRLFEATRRQNVSFTIQVCFDAVHVVTVVATYAVTANVLLTVGAYAVTYTLFNVTYLTAVFHVAGFGHVELRRVGLGSAAGFAASAAVLAVARHTSPLSQTADFLIAVSLAVVATALLALWLGRGRMRRSRLRGREAS